MSSKHELKKRDLYEIKNLNKRRADIKSKQVDLRVNMPEMSTYIHQNIAEPEPVKKQAYKPRPLRSSLFDTSETTGFISFILVLIFILTQVVLGVFAIQKKQQADAIQAVIDNPGQEWENWLDLWRQDNMTWEVLEANWYKVEDSWAIRDVEVDWHFVETIKESIHQQTIYDHYFEEQLFNQLSSVKTDFQHDASTFFTWIVVLVVADIICICLMASNGMFSHIIITQKDKEIYKAQLTEYEKAEDYNNNIYPKELEKYENMYEKLEKEYEKKWEEIDAAVDELQKEIDIIDLELLKFPLSDSYYKYIDDFIELNNQGISLSDIFVIIDNRIHNRKMEILAEEETEEIKRHNKELERSAYKQEQYQKEQADSARRQIEEQKKQSEYQKQQAEYQKKQADYQKKQLDMQKNEAKKFDYSKCLTCARMNNCSRMRCAYVPKK